MHLSALHFKFTARDLIIEKSALLAETYFVMDFDLMKVGASVYVDPGVL